MSSADGMVKPDGRTMGQRFRELEKTSISDLKSRIENRVVEPDPASGFDPQRAVSRLIGDAGEAGAAGGGFLSVATRLQRKFGLGDRPSTRRKLYAMLDELASEHGEAVLEIISESVACSVGKRDSGRYFCRAVCLKLREAKLFLGKGANDATW